MAPQFWLTKKGTKLHWPKNNKTYAWNVMPRDKISLVSLSVQFTKQQKWTITKDDSYYKDYHISYLPIQKFGHKFNCLLKNDKIMISTHTKYERNKTKELSFIKPWKYMQKSLPKILYTRFTKILSYYKDSQLPRNYT